MLIFIHYIETMLGVKYKWSWLLFNSISKFGLGLDHVQVFWKHKCFGNTKTGQPIRGLVSKTLMLPKHLHMIRPVVPF